MVSTRQMTGATTEESTLYLFRSSAAATATNTTSSSSSQPSSSNRSATATQSHNSGSVSVTNVPQAHGSGVAGAVVTVLSSPHHPPPDESLNLLDLPIEILGQIFSYAGYKKVSQMRVVSRVDDDL